LGRIGALGAGIVALPVGAFVFGVTISVVQLLAQAVFGGHYRTLSDGFEPIQSGFALAIASTLSYFGPLLVPVAMWTTWQLKIVVDGGPTRRKAI
jgi:hypothetical protein